MREVKRRFQDFLFLRSELLYEMPELFLPAFQQMKNPLDVDLKPPPLAWVNMTLNRFQSFMNWLQYHPVLRYHDLVISFVRSSAELQRSMIRDNSFSRRKLLLEKMSDLPLPNSVTSIKDEEYFLTYAREMMKPLKDGLLNFLLAGRKMIYSGQGNHGYQISGVNVVYSHFLYKHRAQKRNVDDCTLHRRIESIPSYITSNNRNDASMCKYHM